MCHFAVFTEMIRVDMKNRYPIVHRLLYEEVVSLIWQVLFHFSKLVYFHVSGLKN